MNLETIQQGLFQFDLTDYHAILGVSLDADSKLIRKRYLKIARKLHPDSLRTATDEEKQRANELLSKLVNPAYEKLSQEKEMTEHLVVLRLRGQQLSRQQKSLDLQNDMAKSLLSDNNAVSAYNSGLKQLAEQQYDSLDTVIDLMGQISELNLAYLVSTANASSSSTPSQAAVSEATNGTETSKAGSAPKPEPAAAPRPRRHREVIISSYLNRAREFELKRDYSRAILEMREAVKSHPNSSQCHSQLAHLYLHSNQPTMARIHLKRALDTDPENAQAKELEPKISKINQTKAAKGATKSGQSKQRGGLFGLFGGKQK